MPSLRRHPRQPTARLHHSRRLDLVSSPPGSLEPPPCTPPSRMRGAESARPSSQPMHSKIYEDIAPYSPICGHVAKRHTSVDIATHRAPRAVPEPPLGPRLPGAVTRRRAQPTRRRRSQATPPSALMRLAHTVRLTASLTLRHYHSRCRRQPAPAWNQSSSPRASHWVSASARSRPTRTPDRSSAHTDRRSM